MTKAAVKHKVVIDVEMCKGCGLCIAYCPKKVLVESEHLNKTGYHFAEPCDLDQCTGCLICTLVCPEVVIEVYDE
ncbi:MAG TPA: 4Fe-4S binding protein [Spirochaetota bacterium]|nr:4Fe-4S binding protein [Spirochaetota bacterium]HOD16993.1 4Fe-4S binding protein [Spirochaetota bacterium]HPG49248.1 4Fe-4S binding protein [Spirochaetota bacterium]HQL83360.1 4Fe-4S binding protein [Spirochaetota bacterium]